jgi:hypothetical protein
VAAQGNWQVGSTHSGRLLCYQAEGSTWIVWSYDAERIAARAVRRGDTPEDWLGLYVWWTQARALPALSQLNQRPGRRGAPASRAARTTVATRG